MQINNNYLKKIFQFQEEVRERDSTLAANVSSSIIGLVEYESDLSEATQEDLLKIKGMWRKTTNYIMRIVEGEDIEAIVKSVPEYIKPIRQRRNYGQGSNEGNGDWDNAVRTLEDR